ncbi:MAG: SAM-dependent methyltransferase, partial [Actinomycetota bacterium]|nr:SAM-dependent methyltransferase [Actinomycetota bacterium]
GAATGSGQLPGFDTGVANAARMWNYWIGGKDNFRADRDAGEQMLAATSACLIRQPKVLDSHHQDDIVAVILKEPDQYWALAVALHVGHRSGHVE